MTSLEFCSSADAALGVRMSRHCNLQKKRCPAPAAGGVARLKALQTKHALMVHCAQETRPDPNEERGTPKPIDGRVLDTRPLTGDRYIREPVGTRICASVNLRSALSDRNRAPTSE
jgi:hypothetical protein